MKKIENITLGCDPELFLKDYDGKFISSIGKFGGTKRKPLPISDVGHYIQEDNVALEFNIPPAIDSESFISDITLVLNYLGETASEKGLELSITPSAYFDEDQLQSRKAKKFGCEPDFNAWLEDINDPPNPKGTFRTCGGHIHIGYENPDKNVNLAIIKAMDLFLGLPSLFLDTDEERRKLYGKAGCFRPKRFGVEYRVLSNFWLQSEEVMKWAYDSTIKALEYVNNNSLDSLDKFEDDITLAINTNDKELAKKILDAHGIEINIKLKTKDYVYTK